MKKIDITFKLKEDKNMLENLCKKEKTLYTKELLAKERTILLRDRNACSEISEQEQVVFERRYIKSRIKLIRDAIKKEVEKTIKRVSLVHGCDANYIKKYTKNLTKLNLMWLETSDKLEMAVEEEFDLSTLVRASDDICEMACSMDSKDFRTYNMLPVWDIDKQTMGVSSAIQNYELVIDDYLNTLGSEGLVKFRKDLDGYAMRERIDSKFEKYLERSVTDPSAIDLAIKCLEEGAYVDLKLEGDEFRFCRKPCTALSYLLMQRNKEAVVSLLKYGANVNIKIITNRGETFIPLIYAIDGDIGHELVDLMLDNGARIDRTFLGINILERALQVKSNSLIMKLLNSGVDEYRDSADIAKLVKMYLRESKDERVIMGLYNNDMISLEDMTNLSKENTVLADVVEGINRKHRSCFPKKIRRRLHRNGSRFSRLGIRDRLGLKVDVSKEKEFGFRNLSEDKKNCDVRNMFNH